MFLNIVLFLKKSVFILKFEMFHWDIFKFMDLFSAVKVFFISVSVFCFLALSFDP